MKKGRYTGREDSNFSEEGAVLKMKGLVLLEVARVVMM